VCTHELDTVPSLRHAVESPRCYRGPSKIDTRKQTGETPIDQNIVSSIRKRVHRLNVESKLDALELPFNALRFVSDDSVLQCNYTRAEEWKRNIAALRELSEADADVLNKNKKDSFSKHAIEAVHRTLRAFELAKVPCLLSGGTLLGWYRECGIIAHTNDIDLSALADHIVSMEHFDLLMVCAC
jgi:hypothetical protein